METYPKNLLKFSEADKSSMLNEPIYSDAIEKMILGVLIMSPMHRAEIIHKVTVFDFYKADHQRLYCMIIQLVEKNIAHDKDILIDLIKHSQLDEDVQKNNTLILSDIFDSQQNHFDVTCTPTYIDLIRSYSARRKTAALAQKLLKISHKMPVSTSINDILNESIQELCTINETCATVNTAVHIKAVVRKTIQHLTNCAESDQAITGQSSGIADLDTFTSGFQDGDLIIIAARPSMGKTAFMLNCVEHMLRARNTSIPDRPILIHSLEMSAMHLNFRLCSAIGKIQLHHFRTGKLTDEDWVRCQYAISVLSRWPLYIHDTSTCTIADIRQNVLMTLKKSQATHFGAIVIDYLQLLHGTSSSSTTNRVQEISTISRGLKTLAREFNCPVIALSQLSRSIETRPNKRPMMSDLRDSGAIEQDADLILGLYRDSVYNTTTNPQSNPNAAEIIILKQRNGATGTVAVNFDGSISTFSEIQKHE